MNRTIIALLLATLSVSCVTAGDLREVAATLEEFEAGYLDTEEAAEKIREVARDVESRTPNIPTDPLELAIWLASLGATGFATFKGVNMSRDKKRIARGEKVSVSPPPPPASS